MRMNHTKQRVRSLLSLFLVLLTIFGVLPINVLADAGISKGNWKTNLQNVASVRSNPDRHGARHADHARHSQ